MGKDFKDLGKDLNKEFRKTVKKTLDDDVAKELKKQAKGLEKTVKKNIKEVKKGNKTDKKENYLFWGLVAILFLVGLGPLALILLLVKLFGGSGGRKQRSEKEAKPSGGERTGGGMTRTPATKRSNARVLKIVGVILGIAGLAALGAPLGALFSSSDWLRIWFGDFITALSLILAGGAMFLCGEGMSRRIKRFGKYLTVMGDRDSVSVEELARTLGYSRRRVERDLERMIELGYFGGKAYLHKDLGCLLRSGQAEAAVAARQIPEKQPMEAESEYAAVLRRIRQANDRIADEELSAKIDRLEIVTARIFQIVEQEPEKRSRIQTFLNYYLPTTQKLLDSYAEFESVGVEGENVRQAKQRIEMTMDKIVRGFEHQLDELYRAEAMDVDTDIRVMESMLRRDTASVAEDFGIGQPKE